MVPPHAKGTVVEFRIVATDAATSTCGATVRIVPHDVGGYYYLRSGSQVVEAGLSFVLCR